jgi:hypothetical protein
MQLEIISISNLTLAGDAWTSQMDDHSLAPLLIQNNQLLPGQDARLKHMQSIGIEKHPAYILPPTASAYCIINIVRELGRGGLIEFALHLIPFMETEGIKIVKVVPELSEWFDLRGSNKLKLVADTNDIFYLTWAEDLGGTDTADLFGMAKYILYSHPDHPLAQKLPGLDTPDIFNDLGIRNDFSCMFWDTEEPWNKELDAREAELI